MRPNNHLASGVILLSLLTATPAHAAFSPPPFIGYLLLSPLAVPVAMGIWLAVRRLRKQASFVQDMLWISPVGLLVAALGFLIPHLDYDGPYRWPAMLAFFFGVLVLAGFLLVRFVAVITRRG